MLKSDALYPPPFHVRVEAAIIALDWKHIECYFKLSEQTTFALMTLFPRKIRMCTVF